MSLALWVDFFEDLQMVRGRSRNTVLAYRRDLELYAEFLKSKRSVPEFYDFMKEQNLSPRSQARVISSVRTYLKFCETKGEKVPSLNELRPPKVKIGLPQPLTLQEFNKLILACESGTPDRTQRNQTTLFMLFGLGCRVSELIGLSLEDFNQFDRTLRICGKGNKERMVPLTEHLYLKLVDYIEQARPNLIKSEKERAILINDRGHRPSRVDVWRWLAAMSERAGFSDTVHPHQFRHACATSLLESGADLRSIQLLLGHASIQTTQIYTSVTSQALVKTVEDHHPLSHMEMSASNKKDAENI